MLHSNKSNYLIFIWDLTSIKCVKITSKDYYKNQQIKIIIKLNTYLIGIKNSYNYSNIRLNVD